jgi:DNA-binding transcriptional LysR family regulator
LIDDPLFVRAGGVMRPTARALELAESVGKALRLLETALTSEFDPADSDRRFRLAISDQTSITVLPRLVHRLAQVAPSIELQVQPKALPALPGLLDASQMDLAIGFFEAVPKRFVRQLLYADRYVCLLPANHPLAKSRFSLRDFAYARHLAVRSVAQPSALIDLILEQHGLKRSVALTVNQFLKVPEIIADSGLVMSLFEQTVEHLPNVRKHGLVVRRLPVGPVRIELVWHESLTNQSAHLWLRKQIIEVCRPLVRKGSASVQSPLDA